jgi:hypothetical protein
MFTIDPARRFSILRATARHVLNGPRRLVSMTVSQSSSLIRAMSVSRVTPALLTSASMSPSSASTCSTRATASSGTETSAWIASPPISEAISSAAA